LVLALCALIAGPGIIRVNHEEHEEHEEQEKGKKSSTGAAVCRTYLRTAAELFSQP